VNREGKEASVVGDVVKLWVAVDFYDWAYDVVTRLDEVAPEGLVLMSTGPAEHRPEDREVIIPATYGTLAQVAANVGVTFIPAVEK